MFLIWSIEHTAFWRPGQTGYTRTLAEAGRYSETEADAIVARANYGSGGPSIVDRRPRVCHECKIPIECVADVFEMGRFLESVRDDATSESLLAADRALLYAIEHTNEPRLVAQLLHSYYGDLDRANRTPRAFLYLHLGMLIGAREQ
jgi:hypothetical protein